MKREVQLLANEIIVDDSPFINSGQGQVFFGTCPITKEKIVIKQIDLDENPTALIKELQVFQLFYNKISEDYQLES